MGVNGIRRRRRRRCTSGRRAGGKSCGLSYLINHSTTTPTVSWCPTYPVGANGTPVVVRPVFATYNDSYTLFPTCSCGRTTTATRTTRSTTPASSAATGARRRRRRVNDRLAELDRELARRVWRR
jgi:hypothetical protein